MQVGLFDTTLTPAKWFDPDAVIHGWFDKSLVAPGILSVSIGYGLPVVVQSAIFLSTTSPLTSQTATLPNVSPGNTVVVFAVYEDAALGESETLQISDGTVNSYTSRAVFFSR